MEHWTAKVTGEDAVVLPCGKKIHFYPCQWESYLFLWRHSAKFRDGAALVPDFLFCEGSGPHGALTEQLSRL